MDRNEQVKTKYREDADCVWECIRRWAELPCGDTAFVTTLLEELQMQRFSRVAVVAGKDSERTVVFSKVCQQIAADTSWEVLPVICGSSVRNTTPRDVIQGLIYELEYRIETDKSQNNRNTVPEQKLAEQDAYVVGNVNQKQREMQNRLAELCTQFHNQKGKKLLVAFDGIDELFVGTDWQEFNFLPQMLSEYLSVLVTCSDGLELPESVEQRRIRKVEAQATGEIPDVFSEEMGQIYSYLALAPFGLRVSDLASLLRSGGCDIEDAQIASLCVEAVATGGMALGSEERYAFVHRSKRHAVEAKGLIQTESMNRLADYLLSLPDDDEIKMQSVMQSLIQTNRLEEIAGYIVSLWDRKLMQTSIYAAKAVYDSIQDDGGIWFRSFMTKLVELDISAEDKRKLLLFISFLVGDYFAESRKELLRHRVVCDAVVALAENLVEAEPTTENFQNCAIQYMRSGEVYYLLSGINNPSVALQMFEKAEKLFEELMRKEGVAHFNSVLAALEKIQQIYATLEGEEYEKKSLEYMEREVILKERMNALLHTPESLLGLAAGYVKLGDYLGDLGGKEKLEKALVCHKKALSIRERISEHLKKPIPVLTESYCKLGVVLHRIGGEENLNLSLQYREREAFLLERRVAAEKSAVDMRRLSNAYNAMGEVWLGRTGVQNLEKAQRYFDKSYQVMEQLVAMTCTVSSMHDLYICYYKLGNAYEYYQERDTLIAARHYYLQAASVCERINREVGTMESNDDLKFIHSQLSRIEARLESYKASNRTKDTQRDIELTSEELCKKYRTEAAVFEDMGGRENLEKAVELYKAELTETKKVNDETTATGCSALAEVQLRIGAAFEAMGSFADWKKALQHYGTALHLYYKYDSMESTTESKRKLAMAYIYRSDCAKLLGSKEDILMAYEGYVQAKALRESVHAVLDNPQTKKELDYCERQIAELKNLI